MKVLVFGNILVDEDSLAVKLIPKLVKKFRQVEFKEYDSAENLESEGRNLVILDVAKGITKVTIVDALDMLEVTHPYSMHDFDLSVTLKILKKISAIDSVKIIAIPVGYDEKKAFDEVVSALSILLSKSA
jgi:Ni,Fe-hydrogenase maturation factor